LDANNVTVFDPLALQSIPSEDATMHKQIAFAIKGVMEEFASKAFPVTGL
jgi:hypothetical protein